MAKANFGTKGLLPPPPGVVPNFENPPNRDVEKYSVTGLCMGLPTILVISRTYARWVLLKTHGWQDYVTLFAWAVFLAACLPPLIMVPVMGVHAWHISKSQADYYITQGYVGQILSAPAMGVTKIAVIVQIGAIFCADRTKLYWFLWGLGISQGLMWTIYFLLRIVGCTPSSKNWVPSTPGTCFYNGTVMVYATAGINSVTDVVLFSIALRKTWNLQMSLRKKILVSIVFAIGLLGCVCSVIRIRSSYRLSRSVDPFWTHLELIYAVQGEEACCLIVCCAPVLRLYGRPACRVWFYIKSRFNTRLSCSEDHGAKHTLSNLPVVARSLEDSVKNGESSRSEDFTISAEVSNITLREIPTNEYLPNRSARYDHERFGSPGKPLPDSIDTPV